MYESSSVLRLSSPTAATGVSLRCRFNHYVLYDCPHMYACLEELFIYVTPNTPHSPFSFFFFNDPATTEFYPLPLHDALPICRHDGAAHPQGNAARARRIEREAHAADAGSADRRRDRHGPRGLRSARLVRAARAGKNAARDRRSEEHTSELQSPDHLVCRLLLE